MHGDVQVFGSEKARAAADRVRDALTGLTTFLASATTANNLTQDDRDALLKECHTAMDNLRSIIKGNSASNDNGRHTGAVFTRAPSGV